MKKKLEKQIEEIAGIISQLDHQDIDVESLMELDDLLELLSNKIKSTKLGYPLTRESQNLDSVRHEAIFIFDRRYTVFRYTGIFDHLFYPTRSGSLQLFDLLKVERQELFKEKVDRLLSSKENQEFETIINSAQGIPLAANISLELLAEAGGDELIMGGVNFSNTTMTDIKNYQQIVIENLPDIDVYLFDSDYRYVLAGGREKERFGLTNSYFAGKTLFEAFDEKIHKRLFPFYHKALSGEMGDGEIRIEDQVYYIWATPVRNFNGQVVGGTAIVQNVTKDKEVEMRLKKAKDDAQKADQAKSVFLANMSHEIRTPLNAIIGFAEQLGNTELTKQQEDFIRFISDSSEHLLSLVNEILILFKLGMGKVYIEKIPFNLTSELNVIYNLFIIKANEKKLRLSVQIDPQIPETLIGDPFRLRQVMINLMSNALKYTDEGVVELRCLLVEEEPRSVKLRFEVEDTGMGISRDLQPVIFEEFTQSSANLDKKRKGAGLGLTICKKLIELMNGQIQVSSEPGAGSLFSVTLPLQKARKEDEAERESHYSLRDNQLEGKKILFADDDEYNLLLAETVLSNWKADYELARNGKEAASLLHASAYDIVLLDIHMPHKNGLEVVSEIRNDARNPNFDTKVLAVTANVLKSDINLYMDHGFDGYVLKPFKETELYNKICNILQLTRNEARPLQVNAPEDTLSPLEDRFSTDSLWQTSNGDEAFFNKMIDTFEKNSHRFAVGFEKALNEQAWQRLGESAHRAIPSFKFFGLNRLVKQLEELEDLALREQAYQKLPDKTKEVIGKLQDVRQEARKARREY
ncbi:PAS domain-containing hybrid sensor histidine kinase/response regulator [uncultured Sunxiuqinia sp.]|uniref:PAS domain-containing hybrid sensor histidine kinase/response regulator n=1 Tax=uncultured Sunxiuqinia sp. TaxID=1573825 RepID=UPI002627EB49|nr:PAS domain-containing hybrid sensor histidine kinase/response regulator [uncultured Sunxiuqinia sp.]